jgi:cell division protein FtsB
MATLIVGGGIRDYILMRQEVRRLSLHLSEVAERLKQKQALLVRAKSDDSFLEGETRKALGLIRPDEIEFRFTANPYKE